MTEARWSNGTVRASYTYAPFGALLTQTNTYNQPVRFQSKLHHPRSGLSYFGYRWYDPHTGRWLSRDGLGEAGGINLYVYCANNPVNMVDPLGLDPIRVLVVYLKSGYPHIDKLQSEGFAHTSGYRLRLLSTRINYADGDQVHFFTVHHLKDLIAESRHYDSVYVVVHGSTQIRDSIMYMRDEMNRVTGNKAALLIAVPKIPGPEAVQHCNVDEGPIPVGVGTLRVWEQVEALFSASRGD